LFLIIMSGLFARTSLSVFTPWFHSTLISSCWHPDFGMWEYQFHVVSMPIIIIIIIITIIIILLFNIVNTKGLQSMRKPCPFKTFGTALIYEANKKCDFCSHFSMPPKLNS
jgi:hypothetical protein